MTIITPRTCLWPLAATLTLTFALSIGLTFRSNTHCYAGTCGEWLFPLEARLHVAIWYCWLIISVTVLAVRAFNPQFQKVLERPLFEHKIPIVRKHLAWGGFAILVWILILYGILVGIWWIPLRDYFVQRGEKSGVTTGNGRLALIALTGHLCDVTMGMALLPISRHSALASFFKVSIATTLTFHMFTAYMLFSLVLAHGLLYVAWIPVFQRLSKTLRQVYPVLNPTFYYHETWPGDRSAIGVWRASLIFSGIVSAFIMLLIFITTLPAIRNRHFNIFYFTHLLSIVAVIIVCLHATTMVYCTAPGLAMWLLDWGMRLYELWAPLNGKITALGKGWYNLSIPLSRRRLAGCSSSPPLAHFYVHHSDSSTRELHPFTTTTHLASQKSITAAREDVTVQFLFRKCGVDNPPPQQSMCSSRLFPSAINRFFSKIRHPLPKTQWTNRLASFASEESGNTTDSTLVISVLTSHDSFSSSTNESNMDLEGVTATVIVSDTLQFKEVGLTLRLEGPYFAPADPVRYGTVVCLVAGTGVSGALALAGYFRDLERRDESIETHKSEEHENDSKPEVECVEDSREVEVSSESATRLWRKLIIIWSVREEQFIGLKGLEVSTSTNFEVKVHLTGKGRPRLDIQKCLDEILPFNSRCITKLGEKEKADTWAYISGPNKFIAAGERACKARRASGKPIDWYGAKWHI